jgi:hypothetical protein
MEKGSSTTETELCACSRSVRKFEPDRWWPSRRKADERVLLAGPSPSYP